MLQLNTNKISLHNIIKNQDTRCCRGCVQNWTKYKQKPPVGHYCSCTIAKNKVAI